MTYVNELTQNKLLLTPVTMIHLNHEWSVYFRSNKNSNADHLCALEAFQVTVA